MADADITIKDGASADRKVDTRTVGAGTDEHRQVVVVGDGASTAELGLPAHDSPDAGSPLKIGGKARTTEPSDVSAAADRVDAYFDMKGRQIVAAKAGTATGSNVNDTASSTTLLSSNTARLGASIFNDSTSSLYVKLGTTASATDFWVKVAPGGYAEVPYGYTGRIDGIWSADASGAARIVEFT